MLHLWRGRIGSITPHLSICRLWPPGGAMANWSTSLTSTEHVVQHCTCIDTQPFFMTSSFKTTPIGGASTLSLKPHQYHVGSPYFFFFKYCIPLVSKLEVTSIADRHPFMTQFVGDIHGYSISVFKPLFSSPYPRLTTRILGRRFCLDRPTRVSAIRLQWGSFKEIITNKTDY